MYCVTRYVVHVMFDLRTLATFGRPVYHNSFEKLTDSHEALILVCTYSILPINWTTVVNALKHADVRYA